MTKTDIQFQIDQLRKDKLIYGVESVATSAAALLAIFILMTFPVFFNGPSVSLDGGGDYPIIPPIIGLAAIIYWIYVMVTNLIRLNRINKLENDLKSL